jgi:hypothetical protein
MNSYLSHQVGLCVLLSANAQTGRAAAIDKVILKNARVFMVINLKTFWLILSKGLGWARQKKIKIKR